MSSNDTGLLIKQIHDSLEKSANNQLRASDLTMMQVAVIVELRNACGKAMTMKEIERHFNVAQPTAAGIVSRLEKKGYVRSYPDKSDKRVKIVTVTEKGEECSKRAERNMSDTEELITRGFSEEEKIQLKSLISRVLENVK